MRAAEKKVIYDLLKKTGSAILGYTEDAFLGQEPSFFDDAEATPAQENAFATIQGEVAPPAQSSAPETSAAVTEDGAFVGTRGATTDSIAQKISLCSRCPLSKTRTNTVPGEGVTQPLVLVVGEGPGADEDAQGKPFVGKAGQLLDKMLSAIGLSRQKNCFITNIVKCRPPMNREPHPEECSACRSFLDAQIHILKPKMILAFGRTALQNLMDTPIGITKLHGKILDFKGTPLLATYHPSALLRDESYKRPAWEDLKVARERLHEISPSYDVN